MIRIRLIAALLAASCLAAACGSGGKPPFEFGIRPIALNLAFKEPELAKPVAPNVIVKVIPAPPGIDTGADLSPYETDPGEPAPPIVYPPATPECPKAPEGSGPVDPVTFAVEAPPKAGTYRRHNVGTITVTGGPFPFTLPFPFTSAWTVSKPESITTTDPLGTATTVIQYEVRKTLAPNFVVTDRFEIRKDRIVLMKRITKTDAGETMFVPSPAIDFFVFGQEGDSWNSGGVDLERGTSMVIQGKIEAREVIDVCGTVYDSFRVSSSETTVDLETGDTSGTAQDDPNIYNVATQFGGLVIAEDVHATYTTKDPKSGSPLVIEFEYLSTVDSVEPAKQS
jgi:hypothetical protein